MPNTSYTPTWKKHEDGVFSGDLETALKSSDALEAERTKELKTSQRAREWEKDRRDYLGKQKPAWVKERAKKEQSELQKPFKELKQGGAFEGDIKPAPGYLLVEIEQGERTTAAGIIVSAEAAEPNTGTVVEVSGPIGEIPCPVQPGDKILFKRYAGVMGTPGLELTLKGKDYRLMRWHQEPAQSDLLGVFVE